MNHYIVESQIGHEHFTEEDLESYREKNTDNPIDCINNMFKRYNANKKPPEKRIIVGITLYDEHQVTGFKNHEIQWEN